MRAVTAVATCLPRAREIMRLSALFLALSIGSSEAQTGLPFGLNFGMSRAAAKAQLAAFAAYTTDSHDPHVLAYVLLAPDTDTKNGLFLTFDADKLVEFASTKTDMAFDLYRKYLNGLLAQAKAWKAAGMTPVLENSENNFYAYKDDKTVASVSGSNMSKSKQFEVTVSFTEKVFFCRLHPVC